MRSYAGIGSTGTPEHVLRLMERLGASLATIGFLCRSGGAPGADTAFQKGAGFLREVFIPWNGFNGLTHDPASGIFCTEFFDHSVRDNARVLAFGARGSFSGLTSGGISLQCRNPFQVLGPRLDDPVDFVACYAQPVGKTMVKGGTNTAVRIAHKNYIPVHNLYTDEGLGWAERVIESADEWRLWE